MASTVDRDASQQRWSADYSLTGVNSKAAIERGLAEAEWYQCDIPRSTLRALLERRDGPAIRDTLIWFALIFASGIFAWRLWGSWWALLPYTVYSALYASTSDSRWHESGHGTAFKTDWMNNVLYEISSFMVMREAIVWRWSHTRHHSDTIIVGRDPEIAVPRPPSRIKIIGSFLNLFGYTVYFRHIVLHAFGQMTKEEQTFIPQTEFSKVVRRARVYLAMYLVVVTVAIATRSILPLMLIGLTNLFGTWLMVIYGMTQHAGLAENVLDHRLNCRTVYMNPVHRFLYWNMNYHVEHHMFPLVPFHALPELHEAIKEDCPPAYPSLLAAWREIVPAVRKQIKDPAYCVKRILPSMKLPKAKEALVSSETPDADGWLNVCSADTLSFSDVIRFDHGTKSYALYRNSSGHFYASDGFCTHGNVHLSGGLVKGDLIECPKHNGRFHLADGSPARPPVCRGLATYPVQQRNALLQINVANPSGAAVREPKNCQFRVVSNQNVSTFIKELILLPETDAELPFVPGDYLQFDIPAYGELRFRDFEITEPFRAVWERQHLFEIVARNPEQPRRNNYSIASNRASETTLRFNVRIATPPSGQECAPGVGSSYMFSLKPGDRITAAGPFGDFHIKPTQREMIYIGGGAGMAPLRAHISHLLQLEQSSRRISFWYGARSRQEIFYQEFFEQLTRRHPNFSFHIALSSALPEDKWHGYEGFVHEVLFEQYLKDHPDPPRVEYYLCGPPMMIKACRRMLAELGVQSTQIAFDEF